MAKKKENKEGSALEFAKKFESALVDPTTLIKTDSQVLRTGSLKLDLMLRGGFRAGTISELSGAEGSGKSTIALSVSREVLDKGGKVLYLDLEKSLDGGTMYKSHGHLKGWLQTMGIDPKDPNFVVARPATGEDVYEMVEEAIRSELFDLIVLDSVASLIPRADLEGEIGESAFGRVAKLNSEALKRILYAYDAQKVQKTHFMVINQVRDKMNKTGYGPSTSTTGGRALRHYVRTQLSFYKMRDQKTNTTLVNIKVVKNAFSPPYEETQVFVHPVYGLDLLMELIEYAMKAGFIEASGSWYTLCEEKGVEAVKVQGAIKLREEILKLPKWIENVKQRMWDDGLSGLIKGETPIITTTGEEE